MDKIECRCGCGEAFTPSRATHFRLARGDAVGYLPGHATRGPNNPNWNGGVAQTWSGYRMVANPKHPNARPTGYVLEHRMIMSNYLGRPLGEHEVVHHINGDKQDNRIENLELYNRPTHTAHHMSGESNPNRTERRPKQCPTCGLSFIPSHNNYRRAKFCSRACAVTTGCKSGIKHHNAKLTDALVLEIRQRAADGETHQAIADSMGIKREAVSKIVRRERWAHVP